MVANGAWYLSNFRTALIRELVNHGHDVRCICPDDGHIAKLRSVGVSWVSWDVSRRGMNPLVERNTINQLEEIYSEWKPDVAHHFTIKPILYGTNAARRAGIPHIINSVTGLGHLFTSNSAKNRLIRPHVRRWYRRALIGDDVTTFFQNYDDFKLLFPGRQRPKRMVFTGGSGVPIHDLECMETSIEATVVFAGRLLREKGISEFVTAAETVKQRLPETVLTACGDIDPGNPSSIDETTLDSWRREGTVAFPGHDTDLTNTLARADLVVLPSYREGTPRVLLEAAALGKPIVTTDVPGCREVVDHDVNGLLVPPRDSDRLATAMIDLLEDPTRRSKMSLASRQIAESRFDERIVVKKHMDTYGAIERDSNRLVESTGTQKGQFCISLDLELAWGTRGRPVGSSVGPFLDGTRAAVRKLLALFERYDVSATWAVVGGLLLGKGREKRHPLLQRKDLADIPQGDCRSQPNWYADDIVNEILSCSVSQEIGCHTLTHQEIGADDRSVLRHELAGFDEAASDFGLKPSPTFIYPRGVQFHEDILDDFGYTSYRGPETKWFESIPGTKLSAVMRLADAKLGLAPQTHIPKREFGSLWMIPSSQFYSPRLRVGKYVSVQQRVRKAIKGLRKAAIRNGVYHLWTHPFNLGCQTDELLHGIEQILVEASRLRSAGQLDFNSMGDLASQLGSSA